MSNTARLFIAVKIAPPPPLRKILSRLGVLGRAVKPADADNLHLTLKFLGDTQMLLVPQIATALDAAVGGREEFSMQLKGLGVFPHARRPSVVWAGTEGAEPLVEIAGALDRLLKPLGFPKEHRAFHPHVTLARIRGKPPDDLAAILEAEQATDFGATHVESVELYQSELSPEGSRYTVLSQATLTGEGARER